ncbi:beta-lactamase/transpeptidase-like protein [Stipitochalara longipes BDJ]|nr:beta-lactamase/transpeptidase-like protein [Stipitochalara longipes BDJ]
MVMTAQDKTGKVNFAKCVGTTSLNADAKPMEVDTTFWLASMSKLVTSIAALQSVDRGHFTIDEDVTRILPEWKDVQILKGFSDETGEPILIPAKNKITLRHLLSHTSGIGYDIFYPPLIRYRQYHNYPTDFHRTGKSEKNFLYPLLFEPGTSYQYGAGVDWAGIMTCRVNGNISLEEYIQTNICAPLSMTSTTFNLERNPHVKTKLAGTAMRSGGTNKWMLANDPDGKVEDTDYTWFPLRIKEGEEIGGAGLISSPADYQKLLNSITFNDGKLLKPEIVIEMCKPQMSAESQEALMKFRSVPQQAAYQAPGQPIDAKLDYGLGSIVNLEDAPTGTRKGTISWSGLTNCYWWADLEAGVSGTLFMTLFPTGDAKSNDFYIRFQKTVYDMLNAE